MNETIEDILREMRGRAEDGRVDRALWARYADRIEAAARRERLLSKPLENDNSDSAIYTAGNNAAMREALKRALPIMQACPFTHYNTTEVDAVVAAMEAALAAPPRNCDVGTVEEQVERFNEYCTSNWDCVKDCHFGKTFYKKDSPGDYCQLAWAQMPYKEGETNGSK